MADFLDPYKLYLHIALHFCLFVFSINFLVKLIRIIIDFSGSSIDTDKKSVTYLNGEPFFEEEK